MATVLAFAAALPAHAQGCAMCYNTAAAAKATAIQALRSGTLILLFPVLLLFGGILVMTLRSRNRFNDAEGPGLPVDSSSGAAAVAPSEWDELLRTTAEGELITVGSGARREEE